MEYTVKFKRVDTGKQWIAGNLKEGKYGPQIGMKKTAELKAYFDSVTDGGYINFNLYEPYNKHAEAKKDGYQPQPELDDEIPFALILPAIGISSMLMSNFSEIINYAQGLIG